MKLMPTKASQSERQQMLRKCSGEDKPQPSFLTSEARFYESFATKSLHRADWYSTQMLRNMQGAQSLSRCMHEASTMCWAKAFAQAPFP